MEIALTVPIAFLYTPPAAIARSLIGTRLWRSNIIQYALLE
jgi:hypothetical protein